AAPPPLHFSCSHLLRLARHSIRLPARTTSPPLVILDASSPRPPRVGSGASPAVSTPAVVITHRRCYQTAGFSLRADIMISTAFSAAPNCTTRPLRLGLSPGA